MNPFTIFLDLDETLIHNILGRPGMGMGRRQKISLEDNETYHGLKRTCADMILKFCRGIAPTKMLTTSTREYALACNTTFALGFAEEDITAYEDYLTKVQLAYGGSDHLLLHMNTHRNSVLIDNLPANNDMIRRKLRFLGIDPTRFIQIREFEGQKDPDKFHLTEWPAIQSTIQTFHQTTEPTFA